MILYKIAAEMSQILMAVQVLTKTSATKTNKFAQTEQFGHKQLSPRKWAPTNGQGNPL